MMPHSMATGGRNPRRAGRRLGSLPVTPPNPVDPAYPDYVSGANSLTGAYTGLLQEFFASDQMEFSVKSIPAQAANPERFFSSFSQAAQEVVDARILLGIHFRSADEDGTSARESHRPVGVPEILAARPRQPLDSRGPGEAAPLAPGLSALGLSALG